MTNVFRVTVAVAASISSTGALGYYFGRRHGDNSSHKQILISNENDFVLDGKYECSNILSQEIFQGLRLSSVHAKSVPSVPNTSLGGGGSGSGQPPGSSSTQELVRYGFPSMDNLRSYQDFILSYDKRNRTANWVLEHLTPDKVERQSTSGDRSKMSFLEDDSFHIFHRSTNIDYKGSGYDRGHLAAAANHRHSERAMAETFRLSNVAPQVGEGFNRSAWNNLEKYVRAVTRRSKNVYVCTGPLYLPRRETNGKLYVKYEVIGPNHVAVPTHFFKVLVIENIQGEFELQSYILPNEALPDVKLSSYLIPLESIERAAGLNIFPKFQKSNFKRINAKQVSPS